MGLYYQDNGLILCSVGGMHYLKNDAYYACAIQHAWRYYTQHKTLRGVVKYDIYRYCKTCNKICVFRDTAGVCEKCWEDDNCSKDSEASSEAPSEASEASEATSELPRDNFTYCQNCKNVRTVNKKLCKKCNSLS
jgi:hypothetical protein